MNANGDRFCAGLAGWTWRAIVVALPSAGWAAAAGFTRPLEVLAMVLGVMAYAAIFAHASSSDLMSATPARRRFLGAIKTAVLVKAVLMGLAVGCWSLVAVFRVSGAYGWLGMGVAPDLFAGMASLSLVTKLSGGHAPDTMAQLDSFGWTGLVTLVQGALMALELGLLTLVVLVWQESKGKAVLPPQAG